MHRDIGDEHPRQAHGENHRPSPDRFGRNHVLEGTPRPAKSGPKPAAKPAAWPWVVLCFALSGCLDNSRIVWVAPSAEPAMDAIGEAIDRLNGMDGRPLFFIGGMAEDGDRIDDRVIIRAGTPKHGFEATTERFRRGVVITIRPGADARTIAHELVHAAGLGHVDDPENLMYWKTDGDWLLEEWQLDELR
jgi:hypothetical protein